MFGREWLPRPPFVEFSRTQSFCRLRFFSLLNLTRCNHRTELNYFNMFQPFYLNSFGFASMATYRDEPFQIHITLASGTSTPANLKDSIGLDRSSLYLEVSKFQHLTIEAVPKRFPSRIAHSEVVAARLWIISYV